MQEVSAFLLKRRAKSMPAKLQTNKLTCFYLTYFLLRQKPKFITSRNKQIRFSPLLFARVTLLSETN
jgi:hypothetical protein